MTYCVECGEFQSRLKRGSVCNRCFNKLNTGVVNRKNSNVNKPTYQTNNTNYSSLSANENIPDNPTNKNGKSKVIKRNQIFR